MLKDTEEYTLEDNKYNTLPSQYIINLLNGEQHEKRNEEGDEAAEKVVIHMRFELQALERPAPWR